MQIVESVSEMMDIQKLLIRPLGLVPTMGALHKGHLSLVEQSLQDNNTTVVSIFINPSQFGENEDLDKYPRPLEEDLALIENAGVDIAFIPNQTDIYADNFQTWVYMEEKSSILEGASRSGHFRGVATIVTKLFNITRPDRAYFGQKDAQQLNVIKTLNTDLNMGVEIIGMPTIREEDGLAMSSRNSYLSDSERNIASILYQSLCLSQEMFDTGERNPDKIKIAITNLLESHRQLSLDYVSVADLETLNEVNLIDKPVLILVAARIGTTRLIDNLVIRTE